MKFQVIRNESNHEPKAVGTFKSEEVRTIYTSMCENLQGELYSSLCIVMNAIAEEKVDSVRFITFNYPNEANAVYTIKFLTD